MVTISSPVRPLLKSGRNTYRFQIENSIVSSASLSVIFSFQIYSLLDNVFDSGIILFYPFSHSYSKPYSKANGPTSLKCGFPCKPSYLISFI